MIPKRILNNPEQLVKDLYITKEDGGIPGHVIDQIKLIKSYYGDKIRGRKVDDMDESQLYRISERIINDAYETVNNLRRLDKDKRVILNTIVEILKARNNNQYSGDLEERLAIQSENEDGESFNELINKVLNYKPEKEVITLFPVPI